MARPDQLVGLAERVRWIWSDLTTVSARAHDLKLLKVSLKLSDIELELLQLHQELIDAANKTATAPHREHLFESYDDVPF